MPDLTVNHTTFGYTKSELKQIIATLDGADDPGVGSIVVRLDWDMGSDVTLSFIISMKDAIRLQKDLAKIIPPSPLKLWEQP